MSLEWKREALKKAMRVPNELLEDREMLRNNAEYILITHLRAVVHSLRILGEPKTDYDYLELFGKTENELVDEWEEFRLENGPDPYEGIWQVLIENELAHQP